MYLLSRPCTNARIRRFTRSMFHYPMESILEGESIWTHHSKLTLEDGQILQILAQRFLEDHDLTLERLASKSISVPEDSSILYLLRSSLIQVLDPNHVLLMSIRGLVLYHRLIPSSASSSLSQRILINPCSRSTPSSQDRTFLFSVSKFPGFSNPSIIHSPRSPSC
jgi:hypothetical protein